MNPSENRESSARQDTISVDGFESYVENQGHRLNKEAILNEPRTILLVEDEIFVREVASEVLRAAGYRVLSAQNAAEAAQIYDEAEGDVDLLLTDLILPGESGRDLGKSLRRDDPFLPVLLATGYGDQDCGAGEECLAKPFASEDLLCKVRRLIKKSPRPPISRGPAPAYGLQNLRWNVV